METINIIKERGHILLPIGEKRALLDTGSPVSVAPEPFEFLNIVRNPVRTLGGRTPKDMAALGGLSFNTVIGLDILHRYTVRLRWREGCLDFGEDIPDGPIGSPLEEILPIFPARLFNEPARVYFDSGAWLAYIDSRLVADMPPSGHQEDFHPVIGPFTTDIWRVPVLLDDRLIEIECGVEPDALIQSMGDYRNRGDISAVIGTQLLEYYDCTISWPRRTISWTRVN